jgi:hypothetical protein
MTHSDINTTFAVDAHRLGLHGIVLCPVCGEYLGDADDLAEHRRANIYCQQPVINNFAGRAFYRRDFSGRDLRHADFNGAILVNCVFDGADLTGAVFHNAEIIDCSWLGANVQSADFSGVTLDYRQYPRHEWGVIGEPSTDPDIEEIEAN